MSSEMINGHRVEIRDLRPIGSKRTSMCMRCGTSGIRKLKKNKCEARAP